MTVELIGFITLLIGFLSLAGRPPLIVYTFLCFTLLGSAAAFILDSLGGTSITPGHLLMAFLLVKLLSDHATFRKTTEGLTFGHPGFWLMLTTIYGTISAYFLPRIFAGQTYIVMVRLAKGGMLEPDMSNLTQTVYLIGDFLCFIVLYGYASTREGVKVLGNAALLCTALNLVFAFLDLVTYFTNTTELLAFIRNSTYALLNDSDIAGFKRIVGSFTETSSFSYATLGYFGFVSSLWLHGIRSHLTATLTVLSLTALVFSTSTTAYVGLALFVFFCYLQTVLTLFRRPITSQMAFFIAGIPIILSFVIIVIALNETISSYFQGLLDTMVFNKLTSDSGVERSSWNRLAIQNFWDTFGFGIGIGSTRTSSFPISVLASLGVIGTVIFALFFTGVLFSPRDNDPVAGAYQQAAKSACIAWLIAASISGVLVDLGLPFFAFAALACSQGRLTSTKRYRKFTNAFRPYNLRPTGMSSSGQR